jgi:zinc/manganese transport system substrate-binding protein
MQMFAFAFYGGEKMKQLNKKGKRRLIFALLSTAIAIAMTACSAPVSDNSSSSGKIIYAVGAENEYSDVIEQIGGKYVSVNSIISNPSTDPHSYEANTKDASAVGKATLIVENGLGYDDFIDKLESSSPNSKRTVIDVSKALGYSEGTPNPHLWYKPDTMPKVAALIEKNLESQMPDQKEYFNNRLKTFDDSLEGWNNDLNKIAQDYNGVGVAVTEPVADYLLEAAHLNVKTPWGFQVSVMNGTDPSPQNVQIQENLLKNKEVKVLIYNQQAVNDATTTLIKLAKSNNIPIVGVYETMPPKYNYQKWMEEETNNILKALNSDVSTETMP